MDVTAALAVYAAVVSTALAAWSIKKHLYQRDRLVIDARLERQRGFTRDCVARALVVGLQNRGPRPVTILEFGYADQRGNCCITLPHPYPRYLVIPQDNRREIRIPIRRLCSSEALKALYVRTATGQRFRCPPDALRQMKQECPWPVKERAAAQ